jgi:phage portal protein BeeE
MTFLKEISFAVAGVPWLLFRRSLYGDRHEILQHSVLDLIEGPNPLQGKFVWNESAARFLYLFRNTYFECVSPGDRFVAPKELDILRPDRVCVWFLI